MPQPMHAIMQAAYVVTGDLESAARRWHAATGAGPFFLLEHIELKDAEYAGSPTSLDVSIALGCSGALCIELIVQHDDSPSVFLEHRARGGGFHHFGIMTDDFGGQSARLAALGAAKVFSGSVAVGGRFAYYDTTPQFGGMIELIEVSPPVRQLFEIIENAARGWDGRDPVRRL